MRYASMAISNREKFGQGRVADNEKRISETVHESPRMSFWLTYKILWAF